MSKKTGLTVKGQSCQVCLKTEGGFCKLHISQKEDSVERIVRRANAKSEFSATGQAAKFFVFWKEHDVNTYEACCDRHGQVLVDIVTKAFTQGWVTEKQLIFARDIVMKRAHRKAVAFVSENGVLTTPLGTYRVDDTGRVLGRVEEGGE